MVLVEDKNKPIPSHLTSRQVHLEMHKRQSIQKLELGFNQALTPLPVESRKLHLRWKMDCFMGLVVLRLDPCAAAFISMMYHW